MVEWYLRDAAGRSSGPHPTPAILQWIATGHVGDAHQVCSSAASQQWLPITGVPVFAGALAALNVVIHLIAVLLLRRPPATGLVATAQIGPIARQGAIIDATLREADPSQYASRVNSFDFDAVPVNIDQRRKNARGVTHQGRPVGQRNECHRYPDRKQPTGRG